MKPNQPQGHLIDFDKLAADFRRLLVTSTIGELMNPALAVVQWLHDEFLTIGQRLNSVSIARDVYLPRPPLFCPVVSQPGVRVTTDVTSCGVINSLIK